MWNPDRFLEQVNRDKTPAYAFKPGAPEEWLEWRDALAEELKRVLAMPSGENADLAPELLERKDCGDYMREHIVLRTAPHLSMPAYVLLPKRFAPPYPAVIACPGHGYGYKALVGLEPDGSVRLGEPGIYKDYPIELARRGFLVIVPELLGLGDRRLEQDRDKEPKANSCFLLAMNLLMAGKTLAGYRVHELMRCADYLSARGDVAADRIGCMGFSGGALVSALTAALDRRIRAAVISGYSNTFEDSILASPHCADNYIPGLLRLADMPDIWGLIAPRPLLIESGEGDGGFPVAGARKAIARLETIYRTAQAEANLEKDIHPGKHEVSGKIAYDWLQRHLA
ncbi:dienelactone hydrolase family protein [Paenibacillus humicola]|uniref:dienelactone hydrolase family protein n=1 Tax=Paenibacillus humicola TaxID=3110540 RepID=UPI00237A6137|nr:alpha/beta hydrolase family protein [Paenibacillus humicola]